MSTDSKKRGYRRKSLEGVKQQHTEFNRAAEQALAERRSQLEAKQIRPSLYPVGSRVLCRPFSGDDTEVPATVIRHNNCHFDYMLRADRDAHRDVRGQLLWADSKDVRKAPAAPGRNRTPA